MMNEAQEKIKKLKSREIWMEQCIYVERERENVERREFVKWWWNWVLIVQNAWESSQEVHKFTELKMIEKWERNLME